MLASAIKSGLTTFPQALGVMISSQVAGRIYKRVGPRKLITIGFGLSAAVILSFVTIGPHTSFWEIRGLMFARGLCMGLAFTPIQAVAYASISPTDMGRASSIFSTLRQVFISIGVLVSVLGAYLAWSLICAEVMFSAAKSKDMPKRLKDAACCSMFAYVHSFGWMPRLIAAFWAGRPNASNPTG